MAMKRAGFLARPFFNLIILNPHLPKRLCRNSSLSLRATEGSMAISLFSMHYEIASVVSLPRNDIVTQSLSGKGRDEQRISYF